MFNGADWPSLMLEFVHRKGHGNIPDLLTVIGDPETKSKHKFTQYIAAQNSCFLLCRQSLLL